MSLDLGSVLIHFKSVGADTLNKEIDRTADNLSGMDKKGSGVVGMLGKMATAVGGALVVGKLANFLGDAVEAASNLNESLSKSSVVFGEYSKDIEEFGDTAAESMGQSKQQAIEAAATYGNLFVSMGMTSEASADMSMSLVKLASDLASFNNTSVDDALLALRSGLTGETEPLKRFNVFLNEAVLKAEALKSGLTTSKGPLDAAARAQAAYNQIFAQTATAQGDFANTADGVANQSKTLTARWADMKAQLGEKLLPVVQKLMGAFMDNLPAIEEGLTGVVELVVGLSEAAMAVPGWILSMDEGNEAVSELVANFQALHDTQLETLTSQLKNVAASDALARGMADAADEVSRWREEQERVAYDVQWDKYAETVTDAYKSIQDKADDAADSVQGVLDKQREQAAAWLNYKDNAVKFIQTWKDVYDPEVLRQAISDPNRLALMMGGTEADVAQWLSNIAGFMQNNDAVLNTAINNAFTTDARKAAVATARSFTGEMARQLALTNLSVNITANPIINWSKLPAGISSYRFAGGGVMPYTGMAQLHEGERVLSAQQTQIFERMVDALDRIGATPASTYTTNMYTDQATMNAYSRQRSHALMGMG